MKEKIRKDQHTCWEPFKHSHGALRLDDPDPTENQSQRAVFFSSKRSETDYPRDLIQSRT